MAVLVKPIHRYTETLNPRNTETQEHRNTGSAKWRILLSFFDGGSVKTETQTRQFRPKGWRSQELDLATPPPGPRAGSGY